YKITGMSCNGCRVKVENALNAIEGINVAVTLEPPQAIITMEKHIPTEKLQEALSAVGNYRIEMSNNQHHDMPDPHDTKVDTNHRGHSTHPHVTLAERPAV